MKIIPSVDLLGGRVVRLKKGNPGRVTAYDCDAVDWALRMETLGAGMLHIVDLDGALTGQGENRKTVERIASVLSISVELGGGIRTLESARRWLDSGVKRVVLGTAAVQRPDLVDEILRIFGSGKLVVALDGRRGRLAVQGWTRQTGLSLVDAAGEWARLGARHFLVTDIDRDGTLSGPNLRLWKSAALSAGRPVIGSGGIRHLDDLIQAFKMKNFLEGVVLGRSLFEGRIDLWAAVRELENRG
ncbi:MAG TPA: 1-(5-phosphoribosyl)-5-[(5-phosphoribosylamino)methylideneamino] imidazole-4-carboxamide isomerase [bacterium]|nr:1-(5-phosphoribosyl)-5-[(5-phosphoribosylamino)methylideneamino] imidazole-4-carboxamide isomerase [bacterium]